MNTCSFDGCDRRRKARGLCDAHAKQMARVGSLSPISHPYQPRKSPADKFWPDVQKSSGCWLWTGALASTGYGLVGGKLYAHRVSYELASGEDIEGKVVDHICHNVRCVNPEHLRAVTQKQNTENVVGARVTSRSGVRGVWFVPRSGKWAVQVTHNYRRYSGGTHATIEDAEAAAIELRNSLFTCNDADRKPH